MGVIFVFVWNVGFFVSCFGLPVEKSGLKVLLYITINKLISNVSRAAPSPHIGNHAHDSSNKALDWMLHHCGMEQTL